MGVKLAKNSFAFVYQSDLFDFFLCFSYDALTELGAIMRTDVYVFLD